MENWASSTAYKGRANFVAVCCAGPDLACSMGEQAGLSSCINCVVASPRDMPRWGQLGCNGFIMLKAARKEATKEGSAAGHQQDVLSRRTAAFMQVRDLAFRHVEALLDATLQGRPQPGVCPGQYVRIVGLTNAAELNGQVGVCVAAATPDDNNNSDSGGGGGGRCVVQLLSDRRSLRLKPQNVTVLDNDDDDVDDEDDEDDEDAQASSTTKESKDAAAAACGSGG